MNKLSFKLSLCLLVSLNALNPVHAQDLNLWYNKPAEKWTDALPIGNGRIGAMIYGGVENDHIQFNEETLWTAGPRDYSHPGAAKYLPQIRQLLFEGKQQQAEKLAAEHFMGLLSNSGDREKWLEQVRAIVKNSSNPSNTDFNDSQWKTMKAPAHEGWEAIGFQGLDGAVWMRKTFTLPDNWSGKDVVLDIGKIRDQDFTYVNGVAVGATNDATVGRKYTIPAAVLKKGKNVIAIQVINYYDKGGLVGYKDVSRPLMAYRVGEENDSINLSGDWKYFVQNDQPPMTGRYQADYQPFGDLNVQFPGVTNVKNYRRALNLQDAISKTTYTANGVNYTREYFVSQPAQLLFMHVSANKSGSVNFKASLSSLHKHYVIKKVDSRTISLSLKVRGGVMRGESYLRAVTKGGAVSVSNNEITVSGATEATLLLSAATNYKSFKDVSGNEVLAAKQPLNALKAVNYGMLKTAHSNEYQKYFNTFAIDFGPNKHPEWTTGERLAHFNTDPDPSFMALYMQYSRYLLISSSRPGTNAANLQGIWNDQITPPWGSKYTTNINLEMNYWPAEILNLSALTEPLFKLIDEVKESGTKTAKTQYDAPGWVLHHNTDQWRGTAPINNANHGIWPTGGAWLCHHLWEHYLFTQDKNFLKNRAYPIMKDAALFFNATLVKDPKTGFLISTPSNSPEHGGMVAGPTMDHQIIRDLFLNTVAAASILQTDKSLVDTLSKKYKQIAPNKIGKYGQLQEWMEDKDDTTDKHRHVSHLWGVYPGHEINWENTEDIMKAARQSLLYRGDDATGWSLAWKMNLWARFLDGEHAFTMVKMLLSPSRNGAGSYLNLFDAHPPFQIDGNFGGAAGMAEMILQTQDNTIRLLPAIPAVLSDGHVKGIRARGGFELEYTWKSGKLQSITVFSKAGNKCTLTYGAKTYSFPTVAGRKYMFNGNLEKL